MAKLDREYLEFLRDRYIDLCNLDSQEQADKFKLRYVMTIGEDILAVDDKVNMFLNDSGGYPFFEFNDPNLNKYLEKCHISFESYLVRNDELAIFAPVEGSTKMCFLQFLLVTYKDIILDDFFKRWKLSPKSQNIVKKRGEHIAQAVLSEFLDQPPYGVDTELDRLTKEERQTKVNLETKITNLENIVKASSSKAVKTVKEKQAIQELAILNETNIEEEINIIRTQINKRARQVLKLQKEMMKGIYDGLKVEYQPVQPWNPNYVLPPEWQEYIDDRTGVPYYHNPTTGETQWTRP